MKQSDVLSLVKNYNGSVNFYFHSTPYNWIDNVIIWTKYQLSTIRHGTCCIIGTT